MLLHIAASLLLAAALPLQQTVLMKPHAVELAPGVVEYVDDEGLLALKRANKTFMDITAHASQPEQILRAAAASFPHELSEHKTFESLSPKLSKTNLELTLGHITSFKTRYAKSESGLESSLWLFGEVAALAAGRDDVSVRLFDHEWLQKSVIMRIEGTENPEKVVVVGAHLDSINLLMPSVLPAPGADDDGSGSTTTMEVARVLLSSGWKPRNTVEFHWYSAEELGLLGSQDVFAEYAESGVDVKAMLQQDMTGYSAKSKAANDGVDEIGVITDYVNPELTDFIRLLINEYCSVRPVDTKCGYACSDHSSASKYGYPSAFVIEAAFENIDDKIHTTEDLPSELDFDHMLEHAKLTLGYALELGQAKLD